MEVLEQRPPAQLPSTAFLDIEKIKREGAEYQRKSTATAMVSPSFPYSCPPPPFSQAPASATSPTAARSGLISPPESRRTSGDDAPPPPAPVRQSLPSIHEALASGPDPPLRYHLPPTPTTAPSVSTPTHSQPPPATSATDIPRTPYTGDTPRSEPPYSQPPPRSPYMPHSTSSFGAPSAPPQAEPSRPYYAPGEPKLPTLHPINTAPINSGQSPVSQIRPNLSFGQPTSTYDPAPQSAPAAAPYPYSQYPSPYQYPPPPTSSSGPIYPPSGILSAPPRYGGAWRTDGDQRPDERQNGPAMGRAYGEAVKRHLDIFDLEASLNEIAESSGTLLEFSKVFGVKAHQTQRSGPILGSIPTIEDVEDLLQKSKKVQDALSRIKEVVIAQNVAFAEQQKGSNQSMTNGYGPDANGYQQPDESKAGGFAGPDPKKRRGRAAPPGRCHSCNRAETPEWRRGPDGARTLCNACGLHYAKLTRKVGQKTAIGSSNLRPKGPASPTS